MSNYSLKNNGGSSHNIAYKDKYTKHTSKHKNQKERNIYHDTFKSSCDSIWSYKSNIVRFSFLRAGKLVIRTLSSSTRSIGALPFRDIGIPEMLGICRTPVTELGIWFLKGNKSLTSSYIIFICAFVVFVSVKGCSPRSWVAPSVLSGFSPRLAKWPGTPTLIFGPAKYGKEMLFKWLYYQSSRCFTWPLPFAHLCSGKLAEGLAANLDGPESKSRESSRPTEKRLEADVGENNIRPIGQPYLSQLRCKPYPSIKATEMTAPSRPAIANTTKFCWVCAVATSWFSNIPHRPHIARSRANCKNWRVDKDLCLC